MALKIIPDREENQNGEIENHEEPYLLGILSSWGNLKVGIIESKYIDRYICLENKHEMLQAYLYGGELNAYPNLPRTIDIQSLTRSKSMKHLETNVIDSDK